MDKERPCELNKKIKRLKTSRDELKENNRKKTLQNKKLRDRNVEITTSRDQWRSRSKAFELDFENQKEGLMQQIQHAQEEIERERKRADEERIRADKLQSEIDTVWKKKSRT